MFAYSDTNISAFGATKTVLAWIDDALCVVKADTLLFRLRTGWPPEKAITTPEPDSRRNSRFRGVTWKAAKGLWRAQIRVGERVVTLGYFKGRSGEAQAALEYDRAVMELRRDSSELNLSRCPLLVEQSPST